MKKRTILLAIASTLLTVSALTLSALMLYGIFVDFRSLGRAIFFQGVFPVLFLLFILAAFIVGIVMIVELYRLEERIEKEKSR